MNNPLTQVIPAKARKYLYAFYAALGIAFGATQVGFATAGVDQPLWLGVSFAVFGYLGTALGVVAASNTVDPESDIALDVADNDGAHEGPYLGG